jgi:hypothetical protein
LAVGSWQLAVGSYFKKLLLLLKQFFISMDGAHAEIIRKDFSALFTDNCKLITDN